MYTTADDEQSRERMLRVAIDAADQLGVGITGDRQAWGYRARTFGTTVTCGQGRRWLRLLGVPEIMGKPDFWAGPALAETLVPDEVLRPRLHGTRQWTDAGFYYRAELYDLIDTPLLTDGDACLRDEPVLSDEWWRDVVVAVETMPTVPTKRMAIRQGYLNWAMPTVLGLPVQPAVPAWATAHADMHWANITAGRAYLLDWERWGLAPVGYDAAYLHIYSLLVPSVAAQVRQRLGHVLDTPTGRYAELAAIAEILHFSTDKDVLVELREPMRARASEVFAAM
jgi:hypothetical protein